MRIDGHDALDQHCPRRWCWTPGSYEHRGAAGSNGSHNTGMHTRCCLERANRGCPSPLPAPGEPAPLSRDPEESRPMPYIDIVTRLLDRSRGWHPDQEDAAAAIRTLRISHSRYEKLRRLKPSQFAELHARNLAGEHFDDMVDALED